MEMRAITFLSTRLHSNKDLWRGATMSDADFSQI